MGESVVAASLKDSRDLCGFVSVVLDRMRGLNGALPRVHDAAPCVICVLGFMSPAFLFCFRIAPAVLALSFFCGRYAVCAAAKGYVVEKIAQIRPNRRYGAGVGAKKPQSIRSLLRIESSWCIKHQVIRMCQNLRQRCVVV